MKPIDFPEANRTLSRPAAMTAEECASLRILDTGEQLLSCWQPSDEERQAIADGAPIWLWVFGRAHPPVALEVLTPSDPAPTASAPEASRG